MPRRPTAPRRYNLELPQEQFDQLQALAEAQHTTVAELMRKAIKLLKLADEIGDDQGRLIVRKNGVDHEIIIL